MTKEEILSNIIFVDDVVFQDLESKFPHAFIAFIPAKIRDVQDLFRVYEGTLNPPYFGRNWDALNEILIDLDWIEQQEVVIAHESIPTGLTLEERRTLIGILARAVQILKVGPRIGFSLPSGKHTLIIVFPIRTRAIIDGLFLPD